MRSSLPVVRGPATAPSEATFGTFEPDFRNIIAVVRSLVPRGTGKWLERATGKDQRTTEFWLSGKYQPRGESQRLILRALKFEIERHRQTLEQFEMDL